MKLLTIAFLGLLFWSQCSVDPNLAVQPLSMFRDGEFPSIGYALFALLLAIGAQMALAQYRMENAGSAVVFALAVCLLLLVAVTPTFNAWHEAGAACLLLLLLAYYAGLLILAQTGWLYLHLAMPLMLTPLLGVGYGPWQKALIVYLLLAINIHWHWLTPARLRCSNNRRHGESLRRRVVYVVEAGKSWTRRSSNIGTSYVR